jgi:hypothetical protein
MSDEDRKESALDTRAAQILSDLAKKSTRRGVLAGMGRFLLRITGVVIIPLLPVDRIVPDASAQSGCGLWSLCGMCGTLCTCTGCGGSLGACPTGCPSSGMWSCCCAVNSMDCRTVHYYDCCEQGTACSACNGCQQCSNACYGQSEWCGSGRYTYRCTIISVGGTADCC